MMHRCPQAEWIPSKGCFHAGQAVQRRIRRFENPGARWSLQRCGSSMKMHARAKATATARHSNETVLPLHGRSFYSRANAEKKKNIQRVRCGRTALGCRSSFFPPSRWISAARHWHSAERRGSNFVIYLSARRRFGRAGDRRQDEEPGGSTGLAWGNRMESCNELSDWIPILDGVQ